MSRCRSVLAALLFASGCVPDRVPRWTPPASDDAGLDDVDAGALDEPAPGVDDDPTSVDSAPVDAVDASATTTGPCDLTGRWLFNERTVTTSTGARQVIQAVWFVELGQQGDDITVTRGIECSETALGLPPFGITMDSSGAWPSFMKLSTMEGRTGTSREDNGSCAVAFAEHVATHGATLPHYANRTVSLPTLAQQDDGTRPGWDDWDQDGKPGITLRITGTVSGSIFAVTRVWKSYAGSAPSQPTRLKLPIRWGQDRSTLAIDGSSLLASDATPDGDPNQHYVTMVRLHADQGAGATDELVCSAIRALSPKLTPDGED